MRRKVKCDKAAPACSSCRKSQLECLYKAPPPRRRKRRLSDDDSEKLDRYERILRLHGLLPQDAGDTPPSQDVTKEPNGMLPEASTPGKLLAVEGKSRHINSNPWENIWDNEMQHMSDDDDSDEAAAGSASGIIADPLTGALIGCSAESSPVPSDLCASHGSLESARRECGTPMQNPAHPHQRLRWFGQISQQPAMASKAEECLLFAIYHFAVFSLDGRGMPEDVFTRAAPLCCRDIISPVGKLSSTHLFSRLPICPSCSLSSSSSCHAGMCTIHTPTGS